MQRGAGTPAERGWPTEDTTKWDTCMNTHTHTDIHYALALILMLKCWPTKLQQVQSCSQCLLLLLWTGKQEEDMFVQQAEARGTRRQYEHSCKVCTHCICLWVNGLYSFRSFTLCVCLCSGIGGADPQIQNSQHWVGKDRLAVFTHTRRGPPDQVYVCVYVCLGFCLSALISGH